MQNCESGVFSLENALFRRRFKLDGAGLRSVSFKDLRSDTEFAQTDVPPEFSFTVNGEAFCGYSPAGQLLRFRDHRSFTEVSGAEVLEITFDLPRDMGSVTLVSRIWPDLPGTVRKMHFTAGKVPLKITDLMLETFNLAPGRLEDLRIFREQGRLPALAQFTVTGTDDLLRFHDAKKRAGFYTGSSIPGPLRYVMCYPNWTTGIRYGYSASTPGFCKYLAPGESWCSDEVFLLLYGGENLQGCGGRNDFRELVRRTLPELSPVAGPMYCTWIPFLKEIDSKLVSELAGAAKKAGFDTLVLDDGWFGTEGAWRVDGTKFPRGLEEVSQLLRERGLKFGLWFNIGTDYGSVGSTPENNCLLADGSMKKGVRCFASAHLELITEKLKSLAAQYGLAYFKMDFSNIISPYGVLPVGCFSTKHSRHKDSLDAVTEEYRSMYALRENLKKERPELCLDYSFEVFGTEFPGIAGIRFSDIQHVSNLNDGKGVYSARMIRQAIYAFTAMLPPERISGSLIQLAGEGALENLCTAMAANPLMAGDLRSLSPEQLDSCGAVFGNFKRISAAGPLTDMQLWEWNRDCEDPDDRPDGYFRWSRASGEGIAAIFANGSDAESVTAEFQLPDDAPRLLRDMTDGEVLGTFPAAELRRGILLPFGGARVRCFTVEKTAI